MKNHANNFSFSDEFSSLDFHDLRLKNRFIRVMDRFLEQPEASINKSCFNWAETKAAYRLFDNENVKTEEIIEAHRDKTIERMKCHEIILSIQDTTGVNYHTHPKTVGLGPLGGKNSKSKKPVLGLYAHTTLAVTANGTPLGILHQDTWARGKLEDKAQEFSLAELETHKWFRGVQQSSYAARESGTKVITVCDREADITELIAYSKQCGLSYVLRSKNTRTVGDGETQKLLYSVGRQPVAGCRKVFVLERESILGVAWRPKRHSGKWREANCEIRFASVKLRMTEKPKSIDKVNDEDLIAYCVLVTELNPPQDRNEISWILLTDQPVQNLSDALRVIDIYMKRWGIEDFHKILKSGCHIEECRLGTRQRLQRFIASCSIVGWRLYLLTRASRETPDLPCTEVLSEHEWKALYVKMNQTRKLPKKPPSLYQATRWIGQLGGHLGRKSDGEPGPTVIWRGWQRVTEMAAMYELMTCG